MEHQSEKKEGFLQRLQEKWGLNSIQQVIVILIVFSLTGFSSVAVKDFLFRIIGFGEETKGWIKTVVYLILIFPIYQVLLLCYGWIFGQFQFFWDKEKKIGMAILKVFRIQK